MIGSSPQSRASHLPLALTVCLAAAAIAPLSASVDTGRLRVFRYLMGTSIRVEAFGGDPEARQHAGEEAFAAVAEVDRLMSSYRTDSELAAVNRGAAAGPVPVSAPLFSVLEAAERVARQSDGAFDVTIGPLLQVWGVRNHQPRVPGAAEVAALRPLVDYRNVLLDPRAHTVHFARGGMEIDLEGIAKGFAAEVAAGSLRRRQLSGVVDAGGAQYLVGAPPGKTSWSVGIGRPDRPGDLVGSVDVGETAIASCADASAPSTAGAGATHMLFDPRTLQPATASLAVTIVSADGAVAAALCRAALVLGPEQGLPLLNSFDLTWGVVAVRGSDGQIAVAVSPGHRTAFHPVAAR